MKRNRSEFEKNEKTPPVLMIDKPSVDKPWCEGPVKFDDPDWISVWCGAKINLMTTWGEDLLIVCAGDLVVSVGPSRYRAALTRHNLLLPRVCVLDDRAYLANHQCAVVVLDRELREVTLVDVSVFISTMFLLRGEISCFSMESLTLSVFRTEDFARRRVKLAEVSTSEVSQWGRFGKNKGRRLIYHVGAWGDAIFAASSVPEQMVLVWDSEWRVVRRHGIKTASTFKTWNQYLCCVSILRMEVLSPDSEAPVYTVDTHESSLSMDDYLLVDLGEGMNYTMSILNQKFKKVGEIGVGFYPSLLWRGMVIGRYPNTLVGCRVKKLEELNEGVKSR
jgi:hypothetical protein